MGNEQSEQKNKNKNKSKNKIKGDFTETYLKNLNKKKANQNGLKEKDETETRETFQIKSNLRNITYISKNWDESFDYCVKKINKENVLLEINKSEKLSYSELFEAQKNVLVSVLGLKNSGKTFVLNNLNEKIFFDQTSETLFEEKGLYIRIAKSAESNIIFMECPSYDGFYNEPELNETIEINNKFFVNFCLKYSQLIILVVNELTIEDFYMINLIKLQCSTNQRIIIVHNLMHFLADEEIKNYVKNFFINNENSILMPNTYKKAGMFYTDEQNKFYYEENFINTSDNNKEINITHLVLANYENEDLFYKYITSIDFIKVIIKDCSKSSETFKIKEKLLEFLKENKKFYNFGINKQNEIYYDDSLKNSKISKISKISEIHLDKKFSPNFCYYIDKKRNKFIIEVETIFNPTDFKINNEKQSDTGKQIITMNFTKEINNKNDKELCDLIPKDYDIQLGKCELKLIIPFDLVYFDSSVKTMKFTFENGKIKIEYEIMDFNKDDSNDSKVELINENSDDQSDNEEKQKEEKEKEEEEKEEEEKEEKKREKEEEEEEEEEEKEEEEKEEKEREEEEEEKEEDENR